MTRRDPIIRPGSMQVVSRHEGVGTLKTDRCSAKTCQVQSSEYFWTLWIIWIQRHSTIKRGATSRGPKQEDPLDWIRILFLTHGISDPIVRPVESNAERSPNPASAFSHPQASGDRADANTGSDHCSQPPQPTTIQYLLSITYYLLPTFFFFQ